MRRGRVLGHANNKPPREKHLYDGELGGSLGFNRAILKKYHRSVNVGKVRICQLIELKVDLAAKYIFS